MAAMLPQTKNISIVTESSVDSAALWYFSLSSYDIAVFSGPTCTYMHSNMNNMYI